jgi:hypothetical protein
LDGTDLFAVASISLWLGMKINSSFSVRISSTTLLRQSLQLLLLMLMMRMMQLPCTILGDSRCKTTTPLELRASEDIEGHLQLFGIIS